MRRIIAYRPGAISNQSAFECMALIYKYLQKIYSYKILIIKSKDDEYIDADFEIVSIPGSAWKCIPDTPFRRYPSMYDRKVYNILRNADILITVDPTVYPQSVRAIKIAHRLQIPVWFDTSMTIAGDSSRIVWKLFRPVLFKAIHKTAGIIATVPKCMERFQDLKLFDDKIADKFVVMGHPVDTDQFYPGTKKSHDDGVIRILSVSRLVPEKGLYYIIEAIDPILRERNDVVLEIIGDGPMRPLLLKEVKERGLGERIKILGPVGHDDLPSILSTADIFINHAVPTNRWEEYFGAANLEAMSCGLPCIVTKTGGTTYAVREKDIALMVEPRDVAAIRKVLIEHILDKKKRESLGRNAREYVKKHYGLKVIAEKYHKMLINGMSKY